MDVLYKKLIVLHKTHVFENFNTIPNENHVGKRIGFPYFTLSHSSDKEEDYKLNYGNPMAAISVDRVTLVVESDETKVSIKLFEYSKKRKAGKVYFTKNSHFSFITYKFSTNDYYCGSIFNGFKKRKNFKSIRKNFFASQPFSRLFNRFNSNCKNLNFFQSNNDFYKIYVEVINAFLSKIKNFKFDPQLENGLKLDEIMYRHYMDVRGIKYPNNFLKFMGKLPLAPKRILKRNDYRLVESFMDIRGFHGEKISKVLQRVEFINEDFFTSIQHLFGDKFVRHQNINDLVSLMEYKDGYNIPMIEHELTIKEKNNMFNILVEHVKFKKHLNSYIDHINFYKKLRIFEDIRWKSYDGDSFIKEHSDWSEKYSHYTKGNYTRIYNQELVEGIEKIIINDNGDEYHSKVLIDSYDYNKESSVQSNCVKTYVNKPGSFIVSLRKKDIESDERATIEYQIKRKNGEITFLRVQSLGRFNAELTEDWKDVLSKLDLRINNIIKNTNFELPKVKVDFVNRTIFSDTKFMENVTWHPDGEYLVWVSPYIDTTSQNYHPPIFGNVFGPEENNIFDRLF